jgi:hypothetical protein
MCDKQNVNSVRALLALLLLISNFAAALAVELVVEEDELEPTTTLEIRFAADMIGPDAVGLSVVEGPLVITPPLPGAFTWLSRRSGVYVPSEPPKLGTGYRITLREGLKTARGGRVTARLDRTLHTPPFQITVFRTPAGADRKISAQPAASLACNLELDLESAKRAFTFVGENGSRVPAEVRYATRQDYFRIRSEEGDWMKMRVNSSGLRIPM